MKRAVGVLTKLLSSNSHVACILSAATSVYLTTFCFCWYHHQQELMRLSAQPSRVQERSPSVRASNTAEILFVSEIIKTALPSYPDRDALAAVIVTESRRANIDPLLVTAVIRAESMFKHTAISSRGAQGLMQLMPTTGKYISTLTNIPINGKLDLHDPTINVRLGVAYLKYLGDRFQGNMQKTLIAYNWGPTNLSRALRTNGTPPNQSVQYARSILTNHSTCRSSLPNQLGEADTSAVG